MNIMLSLITLTCVGTGVGYTNWATGEPSDHNGKEECVESMLLGSSQCVSFIETFNYSILRLISQLAFLSRWNDLNCDAIRNWMCKIRKNIPPLEPPTLPPPAGTESTECGTEDNWVLLRIGSIFRKQLFEGVWVCFRYDTPQATEWINVTCLWMTSLIVGNMQRILAWRREDILLRFIVKTKIQWFSAGQLAPVPVLCGLAYG